MGDNIAINRGEEEKGEVYQSFKDTWAPFCGKAKPGTIWNFPVLSFASIVGGHGSDTIHCSLGSTALVTAKEHSQSLAQMDVWCNRGVYSLVLLCGRCLTQ